MRMPTAREERPFQRLEDPSMCGIAGFVNARASEDQQRAWIDDMLRAMVHRGPDGQGIWSDSTACLGHRRLSIIDLSGGSQPMMDAEGRVVVTFNGEIYNFMEIRERLERRGYRFRTRSDTEVLLYAYLDEGYSCLDSFEGMFAFALWDTRSRTLFAARDRIGKKPFYYTLQNGVFAFASELSALRSLPGLEFVVERTSIARYLAYEYVPTPDTIYRDVHKLRPGHYLVLSGQSVTTQLYWDIPIPASNTDLSTEECCEKLRFLARRAVQRRLVSDVPLGVFLSGGIDSSSVVALMADLVPPPSIKTFSIRFSEPTYDESPYARLVARQFGTDHYEETLSAVSAGELLPDIVSRLDEPMSDPSIVPTYLLSKITRKKVTVALGGDGGDELFAGYEYFAGFRFANWYLSIPRPLRKAIIEPIARLLPVSGGYLSLGHVVAKFLAGVEAPAWLRTQIWVGSCDETLQRELWVDFPKEFTNSNSIYAQTRSLYDSFLSDEPLNRVFYLFARQYLLDYILVKVDRCSMMNSLEVRAPFLDKDVMEFVFGLPPRMKMRGTTRKYLLKKAMRSYLPPSILNRRKRGFLIPTAHWLKETLRPLMEDVLSEKRLAHYGLFRPQVVRRLMDEHYSGRADHRKELWTLLVLQLWLDANSARIV
ncbi:MAG: asparagine synthase (glutamine-hydrolyzing) [Thermodesulfobacteriota bacterium]